MLPHNYSCCRAARSAGPGGPGGRQPPRENDRILCIRAGELARGISISWGNTFAVAARASTPPRFPSHVLFIKSYREMPAGHTAETTTTTTTRWRCPWVPCHPSRPGSFHLFDLILMSFMARNTPRMILDELAKIDVRRFSQICVGNFGVSPDLGRKSRSVLEIHDGSSKS